MNLRRLSSVEYIGRLSDSTYLSKGCLRPCTNLTRLTPQSMAELPSMTYHIWRSGRTALPLSGMNGTHDPCFSGPLPCMMRSDQARWSPKARCLISGTRSDSPRQHDIFSDIATPSAKQLHQSASGEGTESTSQNLHWLSLPLWKHYSPTLCTTGALFFHAMVAWLQPSGQTPKPLRSYPAIRLSYALGVIAWAIIESHHTSMVLLAPDSALSKPWTSGRSLPAVFSRYLPRVWNSLLSQAAQMTNNTDLPTTSGCRASIHSRWKSPSNCPPLSQPSCPATGKAHQ